MRSSRFARLLLLLLAAVFAGCEGEGSNQGNHFFVHPPNGNPGGQSLDFDSGAIAPPSTSPGTTVGSTTLTDGETMTIVAIANQAAIDSATLVIARTINDDTRAFATRTIDANTRIATIAAAMFARLGVSSLVSATTTSLVVFSQEQLAALAAMPITQDLSAAFIDAQINIGQELVRLLQAIGASGGGDGTGSAPGSRADSGSGSGSGFDAGLGIGVDTGLRIIDGAIQDIGFTNPVFDANVPDNGVGFSGLTPAERSAMNTSGDGELKAFLDFFRAELAARIAEARILRASL